MTSWLLWKLWRYKQQCFLECENEPWNPKECLVSSFIRENITQNVFEIVRTHRIGQKKPGLTRPIFIIFWSFKSKDEVLSNGFRPKNSSSLKFGYQPISHLRYSALGKGCGSLHPRIPSENIKSDISSPTTNCVSKLGHASTIIKVLRRLSSNARNIRERFLPIDPFKTKTFSTSRRNKPALSFLVANFCSLLAKQGEFECTTSTCEPHNILDTETCLR